METTAKNLYQQKHLVSQEDAETITTLKRKAHVQRRVLEREVEMIKNHYSGDEISRRRAVDGTLGMEQQENLSHTK